VHDGQEPTCSHGDDPGRRPPPAAVMAVAGAAIFRRDAPPGIGEVSGHLTCGRRPCVWIECRIIREKFMGIDT